MGWPASESKDATGTSWVDDNSPTRLPGTPWGQASAASANLGASKQS